MYPTPLRNETVSYVSSVTDRESPLDGFTNGGPQKFPESGPHKLLGSIRRKSMGR